MMKPTKTPYSYLSPLHIPEGKAGDWEIVKKVEPAGKKFHTSNTRTEIMGGQKVITVSWPHPTTWHYLKENGAVWMSDLPIEHAQMKAALKDMKGHVLVGGLGLGLAVSLLAKQKGIKAITVVEKSQEVIQLVSGHIPVKYPFTVIHQDLFYFLKQYQGPMFDGAFYDIWASDGEGTFFETVCPLYELSLGKVRSMPTNWNEDVMRGQLFHSIQSRLMFLQPEAQKLWAKELAKTRDPWELQGNIWHDWIVPFFQWWKEKQPKEPFLSHAAHFYANIYGKWIWKELWEMYIRMA